MSSAKKQSIFSTSSGYITMTAHEKDIREKRNMFKEWFITVKSVFSLKENTNSEIKAPVLGMSYYSLLLI